MKNISSDHTDLATEPLTQLVMYISFSELWSSGVKDEYIDEYMYSVYSK